MCVMEFFQKRKDKQITSLEILSIALGISTFSEFIANRRLIVFSDNKGAEHSTQKGRFCPHCICTLGCSRFAYVAGVARQFDQACIIHAMWLRLAVTHTAMWVTRVPTKDNIADDPSRSAKHS